ncbi:hypothetical protein FDC50_12845 [Clostridium botulinum]|uniref:Uncharacterized protein n=1 Tax=Clostridium botulinum TaxID=1491 RepID=A0A093Y893_CLOBO|nr:hypothetical protein [Clostridium botulinum]NFJ40864.1 hypothetical protein [Clostridium botulinum B str. Eklund 17B (NRP)]AIW54478.1 hypothetical protein [Clostridium botulinum]AIW54532.1 hypothetical protein [Clostridium botulinum]AIW54647.1 hypothetical protein [Clostridium botulinum]AIW54896.1 hypothetical protein [Clostridium botulinum]
MLKDFTNIITSNEAYLELDKNIFNVLNLIKKHIPDEKIFLLEKLENLYNMQEGIGEELIYRQGILDGAKLSKQ